MDKDGHRFSRVTPGIMVMNMKDVDAMVINPKARGVGTVGRRFSKNCKTRCSAWSRSCETFTATFSPTKVKPKSSVIPKILQTTGDSGKTTEYGREQEKGSSSGDGHWMPEAI